MSWEKYVYTFMFKWMQLQKKVGKEIWVVACLNKQEIFCQKIN